MQIAIGKTYRNGHGEPVTIAGPWAGHGPYIFIGDNQRTYTAQGVYDELDPQPSDDNLLSEIAPEDLGKI